MRVPGGPPIPLPLPRTLLAVLLERLLLVQLVLLLHSLRPGVLLEMMLWVLRLLL
jgi:hypothetical protein